MKFDSNFENKGQGYEAERPERFLNGNSPDEPWQRQQVTTPGTDQDVWKRYMESRLRSFGSRGN